MSIGAVRHPHRAGRAVKPIAKTRIVLGFAKVGKHFLVGPALAAGGNPILIVFRLTANVAHRIDGGSPAERSALQKGKRSSVRAGFGLRVEQESALRAVGLEIASVCPDKDRLVVRAFLEQKHARPLVFAQPRRDDTTCSAGADYDVVEGFRAGHQCRSRTEYRSGKQRRCTRGASDASGVLERRSDRGSQPTPRSALEPCPTVMAPPYVMTKYR